MIKMHGHTTLKFSKELVFFVETHYVQLSGVGASEYLRLNRLG
jgi:hypothetical protein